MAESKQDRSKEQIDWDEDVLQKVTGKKPDAKYGKVSEHFRHSIPQATTCSLFCGGKKCKYDNGAANWKEDQMAINGLFSHWVTDNILATARPNHEVIEKCDIFKQFKDNGIKSIVNLQTPGEHASCGPPLHEGGFSYDPQAFMDNDIFFYNFGWPDYGVGSLQNLLDMVKVFQFAVSEGKVAVHCHAGLGRTGVLIVAYLVYANRMDPYDGVHYMRSKRPGSIQTRTQVEFVCEFAKYLEPLRIVYSNVAVKSYSFTLPQFLIRQQHILHGMEGRNLKYVPKIIAVICERLLQLAKKGRPQLQMRSSFNLMMETTPAAFNNKPSHRLETKASNASLHSSPSVPNHLNIQDPKLSHSMENIPSHEKNINREDDMSDEENAEESIYNGRKVNGAGSSLSDAAGLYGTEDIGMAMAASEYTEEVTNVVQDYKKGLNEVHGTWKRLEGERDPFVLSMLMWDWIDHLREAIIGSQDIPLLLNHVDDPDVGMTKLSKGTRYVTDLLLQVMVELRPLSDDTEMNLIQRMLSTLTQQHVELEATDVTVAARVTVKRRTTNPGEMTGNTTIRLLQFFYKLLEAKLAKAGD